MAITPDRQPYIQTIDRDWYRGMVAEVAMLRLDVIHREVSGNKWYKLKYNVAYCKEQGIGAILTFGGAYSNHLVATAAMAQLSGLKSTGIVKGQYAAHNLTQTLQSCINYGMQLVFVTNEDYKRKNDVDYLAQLAIAYGSPLIIPEGGANDLGRAGAGEITELIPSRFTHIVLSVGTGSTLCGITNKIDDSQVVGFAPMKDGAYLNEEVRPYIKEGSGDKYRIYDDWHFGGFGKNTAELLSFMNEFYEQTNIPLDTVYTSKMMYGLREQLFSGIYPEEARILCIHTGGLQGNNSVADKLIYS